MRARERWLFGLCFAAASFASLLAIFVPHRLPLLDWPQHLAIVSALAHAHVPAFARYVESDVHLTTYLAFYESSALLAHLVPVDTACRVALAIGVVGTPLATIAMLRAFERAPWPALLAFTPAFSWPFAMGFASFVEAVPFALWGIASYERALHEPNVRRTATVAALAVLTFFIHAFAFLALVFAAIVLTLAHRRGRRQAVLAFAPASVLFAAWAARDVVHTTWAGMGHGRAQFMGENHGRALLAGFDSPYPWLKARDFVPYFNEIFRDRSDTLLAAVWLLVLVAWVALGVRERRRAGASWRACFTARGPLLFASFVVLYFVLPMLYAGVWAIAPRAVLFAACTATLCIHENTRWAPRLAAASLAVITPCVYLAHFAAFDRDARSFDAIVVAVPDGARVMGLMFDRDSASMSNAPYTHFAAYAMAEHGGASGFTFAHNVSTPLRFRNVAQLPNPGDMNEWQPERWRRDLQGPYYDIVMVRGGDDMLSPFGGIDGLALLAREGPWRLYRNRVDNGDVALVALREQFGSATVSVLRGGERRACAPSAGPRFRCGEGATSWVGPTEVMFDGVREPCVFAPSMRDAVTVLFHSIPRGATRIAGYFGVPDGAERTDAVTLRFTAGGRLLSAGRTAPRAGYQTFSASFPPSEAQTIEVHIAADDGMDHPFCFAATLFRR